MFFVFQNYFIGNTIYIKEGVGASSNTHKLNTAYLTLDVFFSQQSSPIAMFFSSVIEKSPLKYKKTSASMFFIQCLARLFPRHRGNQRYTFSKSIRKGISGEGERKMPKKLAGFLLLPTMRKTLIAPAHLVMQPLYYKNYQKEIGKNRALILIKSLKRRKKLW